MPCSSLMQSIYMISHSLLFRLWFDIWYAFSRNFISYLIEDRGERGIGTSCQSVFNIDFCWCIVLSFYAYDIVIAGFSMRFQLVSSWDIYHFYIVFRIICCRFHTRYMLLLAFDAAKRPVTKMPVYIIIIVSFLLFLYFFLHFKAFRFSC